MKKNVIKLKIKKEFNKYMLLDYLATFNCSLSYLNNLVNTKKIMVNNKVATTGKIVLTSGDNIVVETEYEEIPLFKKEIRVLYEDDHVLVVNKESGILVHSDGNTNETLTNAAAYYLSKKQECTYVYPIHRLDYETTGIVVFAKNRLALSYLSVEIEKHNLEKEYVCLCYGKFDKENGEINKPIGKDRHSNKQIISKTGKESLTQYYVLSNEKISKVRVVIKHGRKHQIRVHFQSIGHELVGDKLYGRVTNDALKLHFKRVVFAHPYTREKMEIVCKEDF